MVEWLITAVLKTAGPQGPGGSNPSLSAIFDLQGTNGFDLVDMTRMRSVAPGPYNLANETANNGNLIQFPAFGGSLAVAA